MKYLFFALIAIPLYVQASNNDAFVIMRKSHIAMYYPAKNGIAQVIMKLLKT